MLRLVAGRIVEASRVIWRRGVILWEPLLPDERSFTSSSSRVDDVVFSGKVADGVKEVPTTSLQRVVLLGIRVLCCGRFRAKKWQMVGVKEKVSTHTVGFAKKKDIVRF